MAIRNSMVVSFDVTFNQSTHWGDILHRIMYGGSERLELLDSWSGCPHNGGEHSLSVRDTKDNLITWFEMIEEDFPNHKGLEIVKIIKEELNKHSSRKRTVLKRIVDSMPYIEEYRNDRRNRFACKVVSNK